MSDFLTNLAARAIAPPTLRPRIRSRFEPAPEEPLSPEWPASPTARRPLAGRSAGSLAGPTRIEAAEETPAGRLPADRPASGRRAPEATASAEPETTTHVSREVEHDVRRVIETQERVVRVPESIETEREVVRHRYETQPPRLIRERSPEIHHHRHTRITSDRAPRVVAPAREIVTQRAAEPTVHVSIGRIEVRATPQPQQPHREQKRGMSIDDYVARRKAKERR